MRAVRLALSLPLLIALTACPQTPSQDVRLLEEADNGSGRSFISGEARRWEGETDYYYSSRAPADGVRANPFSTVVFLSSVPVNLSVTGDGQPWVRREVAAQANAFESAYAYFFGPRPGAADPDASNAQRSQIILSPARQPTAIDHGRAFAITLTDAGGSDSGTSPRTASFRLVHVVPGRCRITDFSASNSAVVAQGTPVTLTFAAGGQCKAARVRRTDGDRPALYDAMQAGLGGAHSGSLVVVAGASSHVYVAEVWDAAGNRVQATVTVRGQAPTPITGGSSTTTSSSSGGGRAPAPLCPDHADGLPLPNQRLCVSCPSGQTDANGQDRPIRTTIVDDSKCTAEALRSEIESRYGSRCTITDGNC